MLIKISELYKYYVPFKWVKSDTTFVVISSRQEHYCYIEVGIKYFLKGKCFCSLKESSFVLMKFITDLNIWVYENKGNSKNIYEKRKV